MKKEITESWDWHYGDFLKDDIDALECCKKLETLLKKQNDKIIQGVLIKENKFGTFYAIREANILKDFNREQYEELLKKHTSFFELKEKLQQIRDFFKYELEQRIKKLSDSIIKKEKKDE